MTGLKHVGRQIKFLISFFWCSLRLNIAFYFGKMFYFLILGCKGIWECFLWGVSQLQYKLLIFKTDCKWLVNKVYNGSSNQYLPILIIIFNILADQKISQLMFLSRISRVFFHCIPYCITNIIEMQKYLCSFIKENKLCKGPKWEGCS